MIKLLTILFAFAVVEMCPNDKDAKPIPNNQSVFKKTIKFSEEATFRQHMEDFSNHFGIKVTIQVDSLRAYGITVNQKIAMEPKEYHFGEALNVLTSSLSKNKNVVKWTFKENKVIIFGK